jgi:hypothetical protein
LPPPPKVIVPKAMRETNTPVRPSGAISSPRRLRRHHRPPPLMLVRRRSLLARLSRPSALD